MWTVNNPNCPTETVAIESPVAMAYRIFYGLNRNKASVATVNLYEGYLIEPDPILLGNPFAVDFYYQLELPAVLSRAVVPGIAWADGSIINVYRPRRNETFDIEITLQWIAQGTTENQVVLEVGNLFTTTGVVVDGLSFSSGTGAGTFSQSGTSLTITTGFPFNITPNQIIEVTGNYVSSPDPYGQVARFLVDSDVAPLQVDWLGESFVTSDRISPRHGELLWDDENNILSLFTSPTVKLPETSINLTKGRILGTSTLSFTGFVQL